MILRGPGIRPFLPAMLAVIFLAGTTHVKPRPGEVPANRLFGAKTVPSPQRPRAVGYYARGCLAGARQLPETGPTWQAMRLSRNRNWGHPALIAFIERLSRKAHELGWKGLYVGDMSQPRGGPMTSGHASHQVGLDVDIWMLPPRSLRLSRAQREVISSISVRTRDQRRVNRNWTPTHMAILKAAAKDPAVDRIFVAAAIKIDMCHKAGRDRRWLAKIRPLYGHADHFHVRLKCPPDSPDCRRQTPISRISRGDGCDKSLYWWVTDYLRPPAKGVRKPRRDNRPHPRRAREMIMADLPRQCMKVLNAK